HYLVIICQAPLTRKTAPRTRTAPADLVGGGQKSGRDACWCRIAFTTDQGRWRLIALPRLSLRLREAYLFRGAKDDDLIPSCPPPCHDVVGCGCSSACARCWARCCCWGRRSPSIAGRGRRRFPSPGKWSRRCWTARQSRLTAAIGAANP